MIDIVFLSKDHIRDLVISKGLVTGYGDLDGQLTANGFDVRVAAIIEVRKGGKLAVNKKDNRAPELGRAWVLSGFENRLEGYEPTETTVCDPGFSLALNAWSTYSIITMETISVQPNLMTHAEPRSSLYKYTQSILGKAFGEAGFRGYYTMMLLSTIEGAEIELGSRFAQISFSHISSESDYSSQKEANYLGGKLF